MSKFTSKFADAAFWGTVGDRAVSTFAQSAVAVLGANITGIIDVDWGQLASVAGLAALLSVLQAVAARGGVSTVEVEAGDTVDVEHVEDDFDGVPAPDDGPDHAA